MQFTEQFYSYLLHQKKYSVHTVDAYKNDLESFTLFLGDTYEGFPVVQADEQMIRSWLASLMEKGIKPSSIKRKKASLTTFFKYCLKLGIIKKIPTKLIKTPKPEKRLPVFITENKIKLLFTADFFEIKDYNDLLSRMILETLYATGLRVSELVSLKDASFDLNIEHIKVLGKQNKERLIPIHRNFIQMIRQFISVRNLATDGIDTDDSFFLTIKGKKINRKFAYRVIFSYLSTITSMKKKSPHIMRHTFATHMLNEGADINAIKDMLGHSSLAATQFYTHNTIDQLKNVYKNAHPKSLKRRKL